jgi:hypothetical protein
MKAHRHVLLSAHVAVDERHVVLAVFVVVERYDMERAEARGQLGDGRDAHAHFTAPDAFALVGAALVEQLPDLHVGKAHELLHVM